MPAPKCRDLAHGQDGMTMIEVLVAIAILAIVALPLLSLFTGGFANNLRALSRTTAVNLAQEKIECLRMQGYDNLYNHYIDAGNSPEIENPILGHPRYRREIKVQQIELDMPVNTIELLLIHVSVWWSDRGTECHVAVESYLAKR